LTFSVTCLPARPASASQMSDSSAVDRPSTATMKSPSLTLTPMSVRGDLSAGSQFWPFRIFVILKNFEEASRSSRAPSRPIETRGTCGRSPPPT